MCHSKSQNVFYIFMIFVSSIFHSIQGAIYDYSHEVLNNTIDMENTKEDYENLNVGHGGDPWNYSDNNQTDNGDTKESLIGENNAEYKLLPVNDASGKLHSGSRRFKRSVVHLYNMIVCATGCNPLDYKGYGCYCGFLGSGYVMDGIDQCCKMHDWCYDATECPMFSEYFVPYYWKCFGGYKPICAVEHGNWGSSGSCAQRLCECDRSFAECLRRFPCPTTKAMCTSSPWRLVQNLFMVL